MRVVVIAWLFLAAVAVATAQEAGAPRWPRATIVLAGQSNMVGFRGLLPEDRLPSEAKIVVVSPLGTARLDDREPWVRGNGSGVGPGRSLARAILDSGRVEIVYALQCARGGTSIAEWQAGQRLFDECVAAARRLESLGAPVVGVFWAQGETDARDRRPANAYAGRLSALIGAFRASFPGVPFLASDLPFSLRSAWRSVVSDAIFNVMQAEPACAFVPTDGLAMRVDRVHYSRTGARVLGQRFYDHWVAIVDGAPSEVAAYAR